jgi:fructosamine-3-kinase
MTDSSAVAWAERLDTPVAEVHSERGTQARLMLGDGREVFAKFAAPGPLGTQCQAAEIAGLRWLSEAGRVQVADVAAVGRSAMATAWIEPGAATREGAEEFGRALAALHGAGADTFGAPWPGCIGPLPQANDPAEDWVTFYGQQRLAPMGRAAADAGALSSDAVTALDRVIDALGELGGVPEGPCRIHGDLWSGNVVWDGGGTVWLIDPAAHGGHRESDLAMLGLFGVQHLERILGAYREEHPLEAGWRRRVGLHQLYPLLVHAVLFGSSYGRRVEEISADLLARRRTASP